MYLHTVTITGADDTTDPTSMAALSADHPHVEWGILLGTRSGRPRFPSEGWRVALCAHEFAGLRLSAHLCGSVAVQFLGGRIPAGLDPTRFQRIQLNVSDRAERIQDLSGVGKSLLPGQETIVQVGRRPTECLALARNLQGLGVRVSVLYDSSGGRGLSPSSWPRPASDLRCGFAGGLGPDNLAEQLRGLDAIAGDRAVWIDMESRVRCNDGAELDLDAVHTCLELARPYVSPGRAEG